MSDTNPPTVLTKSAEEFALKAWSFGAHYRLEDLNKLFAQAMLQARNEALEEVASMFEFKSCSPSHSDTIRALKGKQP